MHHTGKFKSTSEAHLDLAKVSKRNANRRSLQSAKSAKICLNEQ